jgi:ribosome-binding protein aMBF1 (putative translation factor)
MDFADALNEAMDAAGWSDERLSVELNGAAKASQVRRWRKGLAQPRLEQYLSIQKLLPGLADRIGATAGTAA